MAVQRVGSQIESLSWLIVGGFSSAVTAFAGQNFGARKWARIRRGYRISLGVLLGWEAIVTLLMVIGGRFLFSLFLREPPEILDMGATYLRILAGCQTVHGAGGRVRGHFARDGQDAAAKLVQHRVQPDAAAALLVARRRMGLNGLWLGITVTAALRGIMIFIWYTLYERRLPHADEREAIAVVPA